MIAAAIGVGLGCGQTHASPRPEPHSAASVKAAPAPAAHDTASERAGTEVASLTDSRDGKREHESDSSTARRSQLKIRGLHGTLNDQDVNETLEGRQNEFRRCIALSRRSVRWVSGTIRFAFRVDEDGNVTDARCTASDLGHRALEECLTSVVGETRFRKPSGGATGRFDWQMTVEPVSGREPEALDDERIKPLLRKRLPELVRKCELDRGREHYRITGYVGRNGRFVSAGAVASPDDAQDKVDCVLHELRRWQLPKYKHFGKLSFELR